MLDLDYDPTIPAQLLAEMEAAGKRMGLPLATLERLGQGRARCERFVKAARVRDAASLRALARDAEAAPMRRRAAVGQPLVSVVYR